MRSNKTRSFLLLMVLLAGCGGGGGGGDSSNNSGGGTTPTGSNEMRISVNGDLTNPDTSQNYYNKPAVSVTICEPGTTNCQTINDILLDTGSYGLRIFGSAINVNLPQASASSGALAECIGFADGTTSWGPVKVANVVLAGEPAVQIPIQVIDASFGDSSVCGSPDASPQAAGFTGILGVGIFTEDCGPACAQSAANRMYYGCAGGSCTGVAVAETNQVKNPVAALTQDNNGVLIQLPPVGSGGASSVEGKLVLGIGTRPNNTPGPAVAALNVTTTGNFPTFFTTINGTRYSSFLDTGSNGIFLPQSGNFLPVCSQFPDWFCGTQTFTATNTSASGSVSVPFSFQILDFRTILDLANQGNRVFSNLGGPTSGSEIDFGLPFFLGRDVFVGFEGRGSTLGTGPYWGF